MKILSTLATTSVLLLATTAANADYYEAITTEKVETEVVDTSAEAYKAAANKLSELKAASPYALSNEIGLSDPAIKTNTVNLDDGAYVTVRPKINAYGGLDYIGVVNTGVSYEVSEFDR